MKIAVQVRLLPNKQQADVLLATLHICNRVADDVSALAWERRVFGAFDLQKIAYGLCKESGLAAQASVRTIRKVADSYKLDRKVQRRFRAVSAQPFDDRCLSWRPDEIGNGGAVSIWTAAGRMKDLRFVGEASQIALLRAHRQGESDLIFRDGKWFLSATCDLPDVFVAEPAGWLGVDLGIVNIATTSDGTRWSGKALNRHRHRQRRLRTKLQAKGTKSAKRLLKKRNRKEQRFATDVNHTISKRIVAEAERTGRGVAVENLTGIRARARQRKPQRATLHTWAFHQLGQHLAYKAKRAGVAFVQVDPRYTSQDCSECGYRDKKNRKNQAEFVCRGCGVVAHADHNAAVNIATRGDDRWAVVNRPHAA